MRLWTERCWLVWFAAVGAAFVAGCGGSSSETPEPARPDSWQLKLRHEHQLSAAKNEAPQRALNRQESFDEPAVPRSTWGNAGARPRPAAKPSTTQALPDLDAVSAPQAPPSSSVPTPGPGATAATKTSEAAAAPTRAKKTSKTAVAPTRAKIPSTKKVPLEATEPAAKRPRSNANADAK